MQPIPFNFPSIIGKELEYIQDAVTRGHLAGDGYYTKKCQDIILDITHAKRALLTHSCTAALEMAAILCDLQPGDEVIMPSWTFVSTANAVVLRGAVPVFVDIFGDTLNLHTEQVAAAVNSKTKAIFAVHYAGVIADMKALRRIADKHGLFLIEDAAQALGSFQDGKPAGSFGDMAAFSFHETKNVISGEGGALVINNPDLIERAEIIREKGTDRSKFIRGQVNKYSWVDIGSSYLPGELVAAFLCAQLEEEALIRRRRLEYWDYYHSEFSSLSPKGFITLPHIPDGCQHNGHMYYMLFSDSELRQNFIDKMKEHGIACHFHYTPLHSCLAGQKFSRAFADMRITNEVSERIVRLPIFMDLGKEGCELVAQAVKPLL